MDQIEIIHTQQLFASLDATWSAFFDLANSSDETLINVVPFKNCWTIAQVATHVTKSNNAIIQGLQMDGKLCNRNPEDGVPNIKKMFLDFEAKYNSPDFIIPEKKAYKKEAVVDQLVTSIDKLKQLRSDTNLTEIISLPIFGEVTKLEILYFVLYHTQRHVHQLKNILRIINNKN